jgi:hypothetical protein
MNVDGKPLLDLQANTWEVNATIVRVPQQGLIVEPRPEDRCWVARRCAAHLRG